MKNYNEIANDLFERRDKCIAEQKARRKTVTRITASVCSFMLVALLGIGVWQSGMFNSVITPPNTDDPVISGEQNPSTGDPSKEGGDGQTSHNTGPAHKPYPYEDKIQYLPKEMAVSRYDNGFFAYNQIKNVDKNILSLYAALYDNSYLHRDCFPIFDDKGNVTFSRISDASNPDTKRFEDIRTYLGAQSGLLFELATIPQNGYDSIGCVLLQNGYDKESVAVSAEVVVWNNNTLNVIVSNDFDSVEHTTVKNHISQMRSILASNTTSLVNGKECAISFVYQTRYCEEKNVDEERYIYYAFFEKDGQEYLVQFTSNYTLPDSNKTAFGVTGNSQEECKKAFESILMAVFLK